MTVRTRLALAFTLTTAAVLIALGAFLHARLGAHLDDAIERGLRERAADLTALAGAGTSSAQLGRSALVEPGENLAQVLDRSGRVLAATPGLERAALLRPAEVRAAAARTVRVAERRVPGGEDGPATLLAAPSGGRVVVVGTLLEERDEPLAELDALLLAGIPVALLLAGLAGYAVAGRALRPVERMRARAEEIRAEQLAQRLPVPPADDEVRRLAETLNAMLDRLEEGFERERAFAADASHELRTPLARLRAELELALRPGRSPAELRAALESALEEARRLTRLSDDLLVVARADQGRLPVRPEPLVAGEVLERVASRFGGGVVTGDGEQLVLTADPLRVEQAVGNLVDNALRHGGGEVELRAARENGGVALHVLDRGQGLPESLAGREFARFTRGDTAREGDGAGLGLAIVAAIATAHGGRAGLDPRPGGGTDAWIRLPG
jgi:heavy metal sensor kinase